MTEARGGRDHDPLRPARPRRERQPEGASAGTVWELSGRVEELHEVVWSMVDILTELRDGVGEVIRELGSIRATHTGLTRDQAGLGIGIGEVRAELAAIADRVGEPLAVGPDPAADHQRREVLGHLEEILAALDDHEGRIDRMAESVSSLAASALGDRDHEHRSPPDRGAVGRHAELLAVLERLSDRLPPVPPAPAPPKAKKKTPAARTPAETGDGPDGPPPPRKRASRRADRGGVSPVTPPGS